MFGVTPAYIGKPPPNWKRKQREWKERQARARELQEERDRELSPAVPDPEPVTPSRSEIFGSPNKSGRVYRTYAHKRARSRASSVADDSDDAQEGGSRESSPEPSPSKMSKKSAYNDPKPPSTRVARGLSRNGRQVAGPSSSAAAPVSRSANTRSHPSSPTVYVEISPRRKTPFPQSATTAPPSRAEPTRGRTRDPKAISLPSPSPTAEENSEERPRKRARVPSGPGMSLSEALNRSFAGANATRPLTASATSISAAPFSTAGPSESISVSLKRKPGRPRGRGRGRGLAHMDPAVSHSALAAATRSSAAGSGAHRVAIDDEEGSAGEDAAPVVPAKRPRGRPRKDSTAPPRPPSRTPSRPRRSVSRRRSSGYVLDAEAMDVQATEDYDTPSQMNLHQSVDVLPVARALEEQAMREGESLSTSTSLPKKPRGRPKGSKNKATLEREALARAAAARALPANPIVPSPVSAPVKRGPGRPRKSAPNPPTVPLDGTVDYMEPLKDPDEEDVPHPSTLHPGRRTRSRSRARRNSTPAAPSPAYYLDMTTLQWKPRARSVSASPAKRRARVVGGTTEYQTSGRLCAALRQKLLAAPPPRTKEQEKEEKEKEKEKDGGFRVSRSGALVLADKDEETQAGTAAEEAAETETETQDAPAFVFSGAWEVIADRNAVCDDALLLKTLHDVVKRLGICITFGEDGPIFARSDDGRTVTIAVPCGCLSLQERPSASGASSSSAGPSSTSPPPECAGEMTVSITEQEAAHFPGELAHRITVTVVH